MTPVVSAAGPFTTTDGDCLNCGLPFKIGDFVMVDEEGETKVCVHWPIMAQEMER